MSEKGRTEPIKKRLIQLIETGLSNLGTVTGNYDNLDDLLRPTTTLPLVTVKVTITDRDVVFGRQMSTTKKGHLRYYYFSAHIIGSACTEDNESSYKYVHINADDIGDYLRGRRFNSTEYGTYGITDILDLTARESPFNSDTLRRMILDGTIEVEYLDDP